MQEIKATYRIVTPMFLGGANQEPSDGIRPPSVKGALRFWWRALNWARFRSPSDADDASALRALHDEEARLFGAAASEDRGGGQGCFLLRVSHDKPNRTDAPAIHPGFSNHEAARYLGYGLMVAFTSTNNQTLVTKYAGRLERGCLNEDLEFTVNLIFRTGIERSVQEALIAWGLLGGLGSRSRHGMGSIAAVSLEVDGVRQWMAPTNKELYAEEVKALFTTPLPATEPPFSAFWRDSRADCLLSASTAYAVLDEFGKKMLKYRSWGRTSTDHRLPGGQISDLFFQDDHDWSRVPDWRTSHPDFHPRRVVFGLPHNYGKSSDQKVNAERHERRSSPLLFHVHPIGSQFIGVSIYLPAQFLPNFEKINAGGKLVPAKIDQSIIPNFLDGKEGNPPTAGAETRFPRRTAMLP